MRINIRMLLLLLLAILMLSSTAFAEPIKVYVENKQIEMPVAPIIEDGRTLVPVRAIFESMGATVGWDGETRTVTGQTEDKIIKLIIGDKTALVNNQKVELDVPAQIIDGSTLVPARFVAESLGAEVDWDNNTRSVLVNSDYPYGKYKVTRVVDGDTFIVDFNGKEERVRLIGVDTPESVHPDASKNVIEGETASEYTKSILENKEVGLEFDVQERDHYGRLLAYVWIGGQMFNKTLLQEGYAQVATYPPNVKYVGEFTEIQRVARENNKGFWAYENDNAAQEPAEEVKQEPVQSGNVLNVKAGENASVAIKGTPNVEYAITVYYSSGPSKAKGLEPKKADANGNVSWTWTVGTRTKIGEYKIVITGDKTLEYKLIVN
ncbi:MAG: stalk domain-containing protein [Natronincolaceae bacterium]|jgi:endonuclease YncB( thermonuclease family)|nr:stalk domain-containing protein [Bacillota bacterium]